jgi:predicted RNA binding protein YcfA (HicA-like mRNA interferase family)
MSLRRDYLTLALFLILGTGAILVATTLVFAQDRSHSDHVKHLQGEAMVIPTQPGQDAFGTIQEIVRLLEADPETDWSKVNITALREHLIDMDEVTMRARAAERALNDGIEITITGQGRTLAAIKRMVPAHAQELASLGWSAKTQDLPNGVKLVVTASDPSQVVKIKALGFIGIMVQGTHHQVHHLMMAKGEFSH